MTPEERNAAHLWDMLQAARDAQTLLEGIIGLRNVLAHEYGVIDQERLYLTGKQNVPRLIQALEAALDGG